MINLNKILCVCLASLIHTPTFIWASTVTITPKECVNINSDHDSHILQLENTKNTRDLGNYDTVDSKKTKCKIFLRSDNTNNLTESDIKKLKDEYNVKTVIDLRSDKGVKKSPDKLSNIEGIKYHHIPLMISKKEIIKHLTKISVKKSDVGQVYINLLSNTESIKKIFNVIADSEEGCILFHCTCGKDRTGIIASMLLDIVGVSREDIVKDYSVTSELLGENVIENYKVRIDKCFKSKPKYIEKLLDYIYNNYGNVENYLLKYGVSQEQLEKIKNRFV